MASEVEERMDQESRRAVNPAARRDAPAPATGTDPEQDGGRPPERQVEPAQTEPPDPLNPGGIGS